MNRILKTNGYQISDKLQETLSAWENYITEHFDNIDTIDIFYYGDKLIMADVILPGKAYASYGISEDYISLGSLTCNDEQLKLFKGIASQRI